MPVRHLTRRPSVARPGAVAWVAGIVAWIVVGIVVVAPLVASGPIGVLVVASLWAAPMLIVGPRVASALVAATAAADGVVVRSFGFDRFVPYADVADVVVDGARIVLVRRSGARFHLQLMAMPAADGAVPIATALGTPFLDAIQLGIVGARAERTRAQAEPMLARGDRDASAWTAEILSAARRGTGFRDAPIERAAMLPIAGDPTADPSVRAASVLVLSALGATPDERRALRIASFATAHPDLRDVLEAAADDAWNVPRVRRAVARVR